MNVEAGPESPIYAAFILYDDHTWDSLSFRFNRRVTKILAGDVARELVQSPFGCHAVSGMGEDPGCPEGTEEVIEIPMESSKLEITPMLVLNICHLAEATAAELDSSAKGVVGTLRAWVDSVRYGYMLAVPSAPGDWMPECFGGYPEVVAACRLARRVGAKRVLWDQDGPVVDELETYTYNW